MSIQLGNMEKTSKAYNILLHIFLKPLHNIMWYKTFCVTGKENLQKNKSYIITPNHQNALMDALAFVATSPFQIVWLARADIFKSNIAKVLLRFMRIMPIFRQRDGAQSLAQNEDIFNKSIAVLENKLPIALFPETTHWGYRKLRSTKKAVPRIAFMAEEKNNFELDIEIVPCGLYYEEYQPARSKILIQYGKPFRIKEYLEIYKENENKGFQALRLRIEDEIKSLIIDIQTEEFYDTFNDLRNICDEELIKRLSLSGKSMIKKFNADKLLIEKLTATLSEEENIIKVLKSKNDNYRTLKTNLGLNEETLKNNLSFLSFLFCMLKAVVLLPIFILGTILHIVPYYFPQKLTKKIVKDPLFVSSFNFAMTFFLFPLFHLLYLIIFYNYTNAPWWSFILLVPAFCFLAVAALDYYNSTKELIMKIKFSRLRNKNKKEIIDIINLRKEIIQTVLSLWK